MLLNIVEIAKDVFRDKETIIVEDLSDARVKIWYRNKRKFRKIGASDPRPFVMPKFIELDVELAEAIGLYLGDGKTTQNDSQHLDFSSKDSDIIIFMLNFFTNRFLVNMNNMTISIHYKYGTENEVLNKWSKLLKIPKDKFKISYQARNRYDTMSIQINSVILRKIFLKIIDRQLDRIKSDKYLRRGFLRGYFAAEGSIAFKKKDNYLEYIGFSYNASKEAWLRDYCISCLNSEGIVARYKEKGKNGLIYINRWKNYYKLWSIGIFDKCERKKNLFQRILFSRRIYCDLDDTFRLKLLKSNLTQKEVAELIGSWQANVCRTIEGKHLLRLDQVKVLSDYHKISKEEILSGIKRIRIGNTKLLIYDKSLVTKMFLI